MFILNNTITELKRVSAIR